MKIDFKVEESDKIDGLKIIYPTISKDVRGNIWTGVSPNIISDSFNPLLIFNIFTKDS